MERLKNKEVCERLGFWTTAELGFAIYSGQLPIGIATPPNANGNKKWIVRVYRERFERYMTGQDMRAAL